MAKTKKCKQCGKEINKKEKICTHCGAENKGKPLYKKWWFWLIVAIILISVFSDDDKSTDSDKADKAEVTEKVERSDKKSKENEPEIALSTEFEKTIWKIVNDMDGKLHSIETVENDAGSSVVASVLCKNDEKVVNSVLEKVSEAVIGSGGKYDALLTFGDIEEGDNPTALLVGSIDTEGTISTNVMSTDYNSERNIWIRNQFSPWDGSHKHLEKLIIKNLNDEKSYEHIETTYRDIVTEEDRDEVNKILANAGYSDRVEVGDLLIQTQFSAKNAFNATIKSTAYGIASYQNDTIKLVGIE